MNTVGLLKDSISGLLTGTNLNNVTNLNGAIERAVRVLAQQVDIPEATGRQNYSFYDGVYDYLAPVAIFGGAIVDLRPTGISRTPMDEVYRNGIKQFDTTKALLPNGYQVTFEYRAGVPIMRVAQTKAKDKITIDTMGDTTGWVASGTATSLTTDQTVYYASPASLRFNLVGAGTGILTKSFTAVDMTSYQGVGVEFLACYNPTPANLTSITVKLGSDSSNYYSVTATDGFLGAWLANNFQLTDLDLANATTVGTPDITKIAWVQVEFAHTGAITNFRAGNLFISLPSPHELIYQSTYIFSVNGVLSDLITDDNDEIILNPAAYTLLEYEGASQICFQMGGDMSSGSLQTINQRLHGGGPVKLGLYDMYKADNPSQDVRLVGVYYD